MENTWNEINFVSQVYKTELIYLVEKEFHKLEHMRNQQNRTREINRTGQLLHLCPAYPQWVSQVVAQEKSTELGKNISG